MKTSFDSMQRAFDNRLPPSYFDDGSEREVWEENLDICDVLDNDEINTILWAHLADQPWFMDRLDTMWAKYLRDSEADGHYGEAA